MAVLGAYGFAQRATIAVTVQPAYVGVSVSPSSVNYGVLPFGATSWGQAVTATNTGNGQANLSIVGADATGGGNTWTLAANTGNEAYSHDYSTDNGNTWTALTTSAQPLAGNVAPGGNMSFQLRLRMPTASASTAEHSMSVTVMAAMP